jgi:membrane-bound serine protease (ClpP class)
MKSRLGLILGLVCMANFFAGGVSSAEQTPTTKAAVVVLRGEIDDYTRDRLFRHFADAKAVGAKTVILQIDTYGGAVTSALEISSFLKSQTDLHTIAFVHKAYSAGALISLACDELVMEPAAKIGDCAPIILREDGSLQPIPVTERAKHNSPILADFRDSASRNGYDTNLVEAMVVVGREIHYVQSPDGTKKIVNHADYEKLIKDGWKPVEGLRDPIQGDEELLTLSARDAQKLGLCRELQPSAEALAASRGFELAGTFAPAVGDNLVGFLNHGGVRLALIVIFIIALNIALSVPGHGAPEAIAMIALGLIVGIPLLTGYAQWWEIAIIFAGLILLAFEVFVFPGHFVSGIVGLIMVIGGLVLTFVPKEPGGMPGFLPSLNGTYTALANGLIVVVSGLVSSVVLWIWLQRYLPKLPYFGRLVLTTTVGSTNTPIATDVTTWPKIGVLGTALTDLRPGGEASFPDEFGGIRGTQVISESGYVSARTPVIVREVAGNRVVVRAVEG